jgi:flagellar basal body P-ring protein FlgI
VAAIQWTDPVTNLKTLTPPAGTKPGLVPGTMNVLEGATVEDIANGLNALGARPRDLVAIFQALVGAGALHAELVEM